MSSESSSSLSDENDLQTDIDKSTAKLRAKLRANNEKRGPSWEKMLRESDKRRERRREFSRSRSREDRSDRRRQGRNRRPPRAPPSRRNHRSPPSKRNYRSPPRAAYVPPSQQQEIRRREYQRSNFPAGGRKATGSRGYQNYRRRSEAELAQRAKQRENAAPKRTVWARTPERSMSPKEVKEAFEEVREHEKKNPLRKKPEDSDKDDGSDDSSDSEEELRKRKKKKKKKKRRKKKKSKKKKKKKKKKRKREESSDSESDSEPPAKRKKLEEKPEEKPTAEEYEWVEKTNVVTPVQQPEESDDDEMIGPKPAMNVRNELTTSEYGDGLMPGEGKAMATYVALGQRIPRRGEVGLTSNEIQDYEDLGYVMSGSRHKRMNAVRIRKENQIYSAEEKRALSAVNFEEKVNREKQQIAAWQSVLNAKKKVAEK